MVQFIPPPEAGSVVFARQARPRARLVRLDEVADLSALPAPLRRTAGPVIVARLAAGGSPSRLSGRAACERARGRLPALGPFLDCARAGEIALAAAPSKTARAASPPEAACAETLRPLSRGEAPGSQDFRAAACRPTRLAFRYDPAAGLSRAARDLPSGTPVTPPPAAALAAVRPGQPLVLAATVGPVRVERSVTALRAAPAGARLMVRGAKGEAFAAPPPEAPR